MNIQRIYLILVTLLFFSSGLFAIDSFQKNKINLGLDLVGGSSITLEADFSQYIEDLNSSLILKLREVQAINDVSSYDNETKLQILAEKLEQFKSEKTIEKIVNNQGSYQITYAADSITIKPNTSYLESLKADAIQESIRNIQKRIDGMGSKEISIQSMSKNRILLQAPGFNKPEDLRYAVSKVARLTFHLVDDKMEQTAVQILKDEQGHDYRILRRVEIDGRNITYAYGSTNKSNQSTVNFKLNPSGTEKFSKLTGANIGRRLAIVIDNEVVSAPLIKSLIPTGDVEISGNFNFDSARNLASSLRAGALPIKLNVIEEKTVGASLGVLLITAGKKSLIISFLVVTAFMISIYGALGLIASLAVMMNLFMVISLMVFTESTLSLAGIAGLVLTVGMVVDSNVLIFERIKEELKRNKQASISAIRVGFDKAIATIIDSNVTTAIASVLLLWFGDTNIKGFAVTLTLGIIISFFSAVSFTRIIIQNFQNDILKYSFWLRK